MESPPDGSIEMTNDEFDEKVWQAWLKKNEAQDRIRFAKRKRIGGIAVALAILVPLLWRFLR